MTGTSVSLMQHHDTSWRHSTKPASILQAAVEGTEQRLDAGSSNVVINADTKYRTLAIPAQFDVGGCLGIAAASDGVLAVIHDLNCFGQAFGQCGNRSAAGAIKLQGLAVFFQADLQAAFSAAFLQVMGLVLVRRVSLQIVRVQQFINLQGSHFSTGAISCILDHLAKLDLHAARHLDAIFLLQQIGHAALAGLAVDADHRFVAAANVGRVDGQVGYFPDAVRVLLGKALADGILVRAGEGGVYQVADIGVTRVDRQLVALLHDAANVVDVGKIQFWVNAVGVKVKAQIDQIHVAGALAVAKQAAFHTVGTGQQPQFASGYTCATVVMGVQADDNLVAVIDMATEVLDLVGVDVGHGHFNRGRQVENQLVGFSGLNHLADRVAHFNSKFGFGSAEGFRRVFKTPVGIGLLRGVFFQQLGCMYGQRLGAFFVLSEHNFAKRGRGGVVDVDNGFFRALQGLEGAGDQVFAGLGQHLDGGVVRHQVFFNQQADKVKIGL